jgi:polyphosphate glucokinase
MIVLGVDIGGSGIKGAPVNISKGEMLTERFRIPTPDNATPEAVVEIVDEVRRYFSWSGPIGCTVPARVENGLVRTAANIHDYWIDTQIDELLTKRMNCPVTVLNDADAAGLASVQFGASKNTHGVTIMLTIGTGIGSALFIDKILVPNTELGHLMIGDDIAENFASDRIRKQENLTWKAWAERFQIVLDRIEFLFAPAFIVIGGGVARPYKTAEYLPYLNPQASLLVETLENEAGIIGAAVAAYRYTVTSSGTTKTR